MKLSSFIFFMIVFFGFLYFIPTERSERIQLETVSDEKEEIEKEISSIETIADQLDELITGEDDNAEDLEGAVVSTGDITVDAESISIEPKNIDSQGNIINKDKTNKKKGGELEEK